MAKIGTPPLPPPAHWRTLKGMWGGVWGGGQKCHIFCPKMPHIWAKKADLWVEEGFFLLKNVSGGFHGFVSFLGPRSALNDPKMPKIGKKKVKTRARDQVTDRKNMFSRVF